MDLPRRLTANLILSIPLYTPRNSYRGPRIGMGDDSLDINLMIYNFDFSATECFTEWMHKDATEIFSSMMP